MTCSWKSTVGSSASWAAFSLNVGGLKPERGWRRDFRRRMAVPPKRRSRGPWQEETMAEPPSAVYVRLCGSVRGVRVLGFGGKARSGGALVV
jgi:hypothetical protein